MSGMLQEFAANFTVQTQTAAVDALRPILPKLEKRFDNIESQIVRDQKVVLEFDKKSGGQMRRPREGRASPQE